MANQAITYRGTRKGAGPFDVSLSPQDERDFTAWLCDEILYARNARSAIIDPGGDLDYWWTLYETRRLRDGMPWPNAADLTSYLGVWYADAIHARLMKTIFVEPIWVVEGWGESADRAPLVEEFHQWQAKREKVPGYLDKVLLNALVEGVGVLEVSERSSRRLQRRQMRLKAQTNEAGAIVLGADHKPIAVKDDQGRLMPAGAHDPAIESVVTQLLALPGGPQYRVLSLRDFVWLPGHATDKADVWGYAKRFWRRLPQLQERAKAGVYQNVELLGTDQERVIDRRLEASGQDVAPQDGPTVEKELYEVLVLRDLDGDGIEEWYVATVSVTHRVLLRLQHDDLGQGRYLMFVPYPRTDSIGGYSVVGDKLVTLIEEHTAWRNMGADRAAIKTNAPIKRLTGALWDPDAQPFGPHEVIDVRDMNEIAAFDVPDVPQGLLQREQSVLDAAERLIGMNDVALGAQPQSDRTLGETQIVAQESFVRMDEVVRRIQETMEELFAVRHTLWQRALERDTLRAGQDLVRRLSLRGSALSTSGQITAADLAGDFRGEPRGSVETADMLTLRSDFNGFLMALGNLAKGAPVLQKVLDDPGAVKALLEQALRVYRFQDRQAFLKALNDAAAQPPQAPGAPAGAPSAGAPAVPGMPAQIAGLLASLRTGIPGTGATAPSPDAAAPSQATGPSGVPMEGGAPSGPGATA